VRSKTKTIKKSRTQLTERIKEYPPGRRKKITLNISHVKKHHPWELQN